ncbi:YiiG family protein [Paenibacillus ehimensis]|uniref:YiiG family protein n=1 Tax=Paenibacillus ehimensis TaxID=79264 RepID=A0ABT8V6W0_9BACL|nr:YiiG family protein [Paenibacillus ehimensis]MDO3675710.1 YiiG family protein [Paenibacillus ehimensis]
MNKRLTILSLGVAVCVSLSGCGSIGQIAEKVKEQTTQAKQESNQAQDTAKYNTYIGLSNYLTQWLDKTFEMYFKEFGGEEEIRIRKNFTGFNTMPVLPGHKDDVDKALAFASKEPSYQAADESVKALAPKLKELMETTGEMQTYYQNKAYAEDEFAKGKELHKKLLVQFNEVSDLADKFFADFAVITEQRKKEDLEELKKSDMLIRFHAMSIVNRAQDIQKTFDKAGVTDDNVLDFDANQYAELYKLLTEDIDKFTELSKDKERLKKEKVQIVPVFTDSIQRVKTAAADLMEILRTKDTTINSDTKGKVTTGGKNMPLKNFDKRVSAVVDSYNTMIGLSR